MELQLEQYRYADRVQTWGFTRISRCFFFEANVKKVSGPSIATVYTRVPDRTAFNGESPSVLK